jgi:hypothetical protein
MAVVHGAVLDNQVFAGLGMAPAVGILAALDANGIVTDIEGRTSENDVLASFNIYPVPIGGKMGITNRYVLDG